MNENIERALDHLYHRTRIDAHISGHIVLVAVLAIMTVTIEDRFEPFQLGTRMFEPTRIVWDEHQQSWLSERKLMETNNFPPVNNRGPLDVQSIYPIATCIAIGIGVLAVLIFSYLAARRQTRLMTAVFRDREHRPYEREWGEIRVTFWALDVVVIFLLLLLMS